MNEQYNFILNQKKQGKKVLAVLIDPDKTEKLAQLLNLAKQTPPDFFLLGGSLSGANNLAACISQIRSITKIPVLLFPGNEFQISPTADAILLLSLISGRNPELLIGKHVSASGIIRDSKLEIIPTGYLLIESGTITAVNYISNTQPIPRNKKSIAALTALAGEQLGLKIIYLEAGSGAQQPVPLEMISAVRQTISIPLFIGGGLRTVKEVAERCDAGADVIVIGNALEENPELLPLFIKTVHSY